ncbi:BrnA antitoxin family protein [Bradyrhizobium lablabi]|uniref:BrnA antitoxin family protein n=1 Tax=Bradyrhizobium lablabi TaxID=722472 RepID=UPI001BA9B2AE|nr:BrnA antitoxin family protein [Bradyrhizobium lablabi]MBR1125582.1 BrnA antitoxin family protein [Bradyrhizobium lablabi]
MKKAISKRLTREQLAELKSLAALPDDAIDTSDAPEFSDWSGAKRGLFYRPVKQQLTLRLDADVVAWFKRQTRSGEGYQTRINRALREYVQGQAVKRRRSRTSRRA